jgi:hypothetical protein
MPMLKLEVLLPQKDMKKTMDLRTVASILGSYWSRLLNAVPANCHADSDYQNYYVIGMNIAELYFVFYFKLK